jgi:hypothetical protein
VYSENFIEFREFVRFASFFDDCTQQTEGELHKEFCISFFNDVLVEILQPRLLKRDQPMLIRSTLQYIIQLLDIIKSPKLVLTIYYFLFGFPKAMMKPGKEEKEMKVEEESKTEAASFSLGLSRIEFHNKIK